MAAPLCVTVLAAGKGTRMKNTLPKVLHPLAGRTLLGHVLATVAELAPERTLVILAPGMDDVAAAAAVSPLVPALVLQEPQLGTGHALLVARERLPEQGTILVVYGDTPLLTGATLRRLVDAREATDAAVAVLGIRPSEPAGYGRLRVADGKLVEIVEDLHADAALREQSMCNAGVMAFDAARLPSLLDALPLRSERNELYLTDTVAAAVERGWICVTADAAAEEGLGVNSQLQLAQVAAILQQRLRLRLLEGGVIMPAPETVQLSADTVVGAGTVIEPYVVLGPGVRIEPKAVIHSFCHLEKTVVATGAEIGPFARLRPGSEIGEGAKIGNFVETKNTRLEPRAKVNHLTYLGDATVGTNANIGAGTITCNYDGFHKHATHIGAGAFIGSNTALVAPVTIGKEAIIAAGSVITADVPDDGFAVARTRQVTRADRATLLRDHLRQPGRG
ncbi:MAG: bifunctional UDP-N-acetylglucosamine diphosphorylase/glucosamine-1-phosphate N-acetyltransferase GlmU [Geminicoccaceae bacterium]